MQWHPIVVLICISLMTNIWRRQWQPTPVLLAWKIPWTEETGGLQSMGSLGIRHDWVTSLSLFPFMHWRRKWQPTPVFLPRDGGAWWAAVCGVAQSWTWLKRLSSSSSSSPWSRELTDPVNSQRLWNKKPKIFPDSGFLGFSVIL